MQECQSRGGQNARKNSRVETEASLPPSSAVSVRVVRGRGCTAHVERSELLLGWPPLFFRRVSEWSRTTCISIFGKRKRLSIGRHMEVDVNREAKGLPARLAARIGWSPFGATARPMKSMRAWVRKKKNPCEHQHAHITSLWFLQPCVS